jgi:Lipase (class 3)
MEQIGGIQVPNPMAIINATYPEALLVFAGVDGTGSQVGEGVQEATDEDKKYYKYCSDIAAFLSQVSGWSYSNMRTFKNKLSWLTVKNETILAGAHFYPLMNIKNEALFVDATAQFILTHDRTIAIVSFRGTEITNPWNWFIDATTKKVPFIYNNNNPGSNCKVHLGFKRNFEAVWYGSEGILHKLCHHEGELKVVYITGHSLGGAMAVLAGLSLQQQYPSLWGKVRGIYTYGQPMVVDNDDRDVLEDQIGHRLFRHIYYNDIVPHLPPLTVGPFDHIGSEYRYNPDSKRGWQPRAGPLLNVGKDRATQVLFALPTLPFLGYDVLFDNIDIKIPFTAISLMKPKSLWSMADHNPGNYMEHWY